MIYTCISWIVYLLVLVNVFSIEAVAGYRSNINVTSFQPLPNYKLSTDEDDIKQLSDGKLVEYPIWSKPESVGWRGASKIVIKLESKETLNNGYLLISTVKGSSAGVNIPSRVDVYTNDNYKTLHLSTHEWDAKSFNDKSKHMLKIRVNAAYKKLTLVVHSRGNFFFTDEISWIKSNEDFGSKKAVAIKGSPLNDSIRRLKEHYIKNHNEKYKYKSVKVKDSVKHQRVNCWSSKFEKLSSDENRFEVSGYKGEFEYLCLKLNVSNNPIKIHDINPNVRIYNIERILTANGNYVYDPLMPLSSKSKVKGYKGVVYLLLKINLGKMNKGPHEMTLSYIDGKYEEVVKIKVNVFPEIIVDKHMPLAINWAYTNNKLFKDKPDEMISDLTEHYINMFVIHPTNIPILNKNKQWDKEVEARFRRDLKMFNNKGSVLLYMAINGWHKPNWLLWDLGYSEKHIKSEYIKWLRKLVSVIKSEGYQYSSWYIYFQDEATSKDFSKLKKLVSWSLEADENIQIYMNPTSYSSARTSLSDLQELVNYVDLWQPQLELAYKENDRFFNKLGKNWCTYTGPAAPAKEALPLFYKNIPLTAWSLGATCFGFWSYNDTTRSSAWDDFDGSRPDFSVIYEADFGPVSSLRWEGFSDGVENYLLIKHLESKCNHEIKCNRKLFKSDVHNYEQMIDKENQIINIRKTYFNTTYK